MTIDEILKDRIAYARTKSANLYQNPDLVEELGFMRRNAIARPGVVNVPVATPIAQAPPAYNSQPYTPPPAPAPHYSMKMILGKKLYTR